MNPIANPYATGADQQPPEPAGRDQEIRLFEQTVARAEAAHPVRGIMLVGLRGVGKTVLLNRFRTAAFECGWATAKLEVRSDVSLRQQIAQSMQLAMRRYVAESRANGTLGQFLAVLKAFSLRVSPDGTWQLAIDVDGARGTADSGDLAADLTLLFTEADALVRRVGGGVALFMDELQDASASRIWLRSPSPATR